MPDDSLGLLVEAFIDDCEIANLSPATISFYRERLDRYRWWCEESGAPLDPARHDSHTIRQFLRYLQSDVRWDGEHSSSVRKMTSGGIDTYYRTLRRFYNWCFEQDFITSSPMAKVQRPKQIREQPDPFTAAEIAALFRAVDERGGVFQLRDRAIMAVLLDVGLRVSELCNLKMDDYNLQTGELLIEKGKGRKLRSVALGAQARRHMRQYWIRQRRSATTRALFVGRSDKPITRNSVRMMLDKAGKAAGVSPTNPHRFRHTAAVNAVRAGMDAFSIQMMLGHETLEMTRRYIKLANTDMVEAAKNHSPLDYLSRE